MAHLVTGRQAKNHVGSDDMGALYAGIVGGGVYVFEGAGATIVDANTIMIEGGELLINGRHIRIDATGETAKIETGSQGMNRCDLVGIKYTRDAENDNIEDAKLHVLKGTPTEGVPSWPTFPTTSIQFGSAEVFNPLYEVVLNGINVMEPRLVGKRTVPVGMMSDFVIDEGKSGIWSYRKWYSGKAECWCYKSEEMWPQTAWGSCYYDSVKKGGHAYPFKFAEYPTFTITLTESNGNVFPLVLSDDTLESLPHFYGASFAQYTELTVYEYIHVMGRWN